MVPDPPSSQPSEIWKELLALSNGTGIIKIGESRSIVIEAKSFLSVKHTLEKMFGLKTGSFILYNVGKDVGAHMASIVSGAGEERLRALLEYLKALGWLSRAEVESEIPEWALLKIYDCWEATGRSGADYCVCDLSRGVLVGFFENAYGVSSHAVENLCSARDNEYCEITIKRKQ